MVVSVGWIAGLLLMLLWAVFILIKSSLISLSFLSRMSLGKEFFNSSLALSKSLLKEYNSGGYYELHR